jgi:hypothetical protein
MLRSGFLCHRVLLPILFVAIFSLGFSSLFVNASASAVLSTPSVSFNSPVNLSNDTGKAQFPDVVNVGSHVYAAWTEGSRGIMFRASSNNGSTWSPPVSKPAIRISWKGGTCQYPLLSANGSNVYATWSQSFGNTTGLQLFEATSANYGASFSNATKLTSSYSPNGWITPVIASWGQNVYIVYSGMGKNSYVISSNNAGTTWSSPYHFAVTFEPEVAVVGNNVYATADGIQFAVSHDAGHTWTKTLNQRYMGDEPMIAASGKYVYIVSQSKTTNGTIWIIISSNNGTTFSNRHVLNGSVTNNWGPMIGAHGASLWVAWHNYPGGIRAQEWITTSSNYGVSWSTPQSLSGSGHWVGWPWEIASTDGKNVYTMWPEQVTSSPNYWIVRASYSSDGGTTWSPQPGMNVSQNSNGEAAPENDLADAAISSYGSSAFAVWQLITNSGATNQVYFSHS